MVKIFKITNYIIDNRVAKLHISVPIIVFLNCWGTLVQYYLASCRH